MAEKHEPVVEKSKPAVAKKAQAEQVKPKSNPNAASRAVTPEHIKKSSTRAKYSDAFVGIKGLSVSDTEEIAGDVVPEASKSESKSKMSVTPKDTSVAKDTLSRSSDNSESLVGEVFEKGWTLMTYLAKNMGNKEAMRLDVVSKYFPMPVIRAGEAKGKFVIHKNYIRK